MRSPRNTTTLAMLVLIFPVVALAQPTGTPTLTAGTANAALSFDTGLTSASGGDILWNGTTMTPQGSATAVNIGGGLGASGFAALNFAVLSGLTGYSQSPNGNAAFVGDAFAVHTNGGNYAAVLVTASSGTSITLQFTTFLSPPTITEVENNYGEIPPGYSNSGIAPGTLFFIVGTGLATPGSVAVTQNPVGASLPTTLNGASVKVTVGGTTVVPAFYYAEAVALGLVLPSNTPLGIGQVTVMANGQTSPPYSINVVQSAFGIDAYFGAGFGMAIAVFTNGSPAGGGCAQASIACYTLSIPPGTLIELYGSGLGADPKPARDTTYVPVTSAAADGINGLAAIYIGGVAATITYQGASGYPGLNQINLTVPGNAPTGCYVPVVGVTAAGVPTNFLTLPIGSGTCTDPAFGTTGAQRQSLGGQTSITSGTVGLFEETLPAANGGTTAFNYAYGIFENIPGSSFGSGSGQVSLGGCIVGQAGLSSAGSSSPVTLLDAGNMTITGPSGSPVAMPDTVSGATVTSDYDATLPAGYIPTSGGAFTFQATGGANIGPFTTSVVFSNPALTWTNKAAAATVTRSAGLPITWSGGATGTYVELRGSSSTASASGNFTCIADVTAGQFTVPAYVLTALPAGTGVVAVENQVLPQSFTATGLNYGTTIGVALTEVDATFN